MEFPKSDPSEELRMFEKVDQARELFRPVVVEVGIVLEERKGGSRQAVSMK